MAYEPAIPELTDGEMVRYLARKYHAYGDALRDRLEVGKWDYGAFDAVDKALVALSVAETLKVKQECEAFREYLDAKTARQQQRLKQMGGPRFEP